MSNLRNPNIRARDIRKLAGCKSQSIVWDVGCDETSEWVLASFENESYKKRLVNWLLSKSVSSTNDAILIDSGWKEPKSVIWGDIPANPEKYFGSEMFLLYDIDLKWLMEYQTQEIVRFGKYES